MGTRIRNARQPQKRSKYTLDERAIIKPWCSLCSVIDSQTQCLRRSLRDGRPIPTELLARMSQAVELLTELSQFVVPHLTTLSTVEQLRHVEASRKMLVGAGVGNEEATGAVDRSLQRVRGRPEKIRHLASMALGLRESNPRLTWAEIAKLVRPTGFPAYAYPFCDRLERDVRRLKQLLRRVDVFLMKASSAL